MRKMQWVPLVVFGAVLCLGAQCPSQADHDALQAAHDALQERVDDIEWYLKRGVPADANRNDVTESLENWLKRVAAALCAAEDAATAPQGTQLCPDAGPGGSGDPPPTPPFL
jgi:hypothetical protein